MNNVKSKTYVLFMFFFCLSATSLAKVDYWPTKEWKVKSLEEAGFDRSKFQKVIDYVWEDTGAHKSDSFIVIKDGYLVYEGYDRGYHPTRKHMFWSLTKSMTSTIMGAAIHRGYIDLEAKAADYYPVMNRDKARHVTLRHILNMSAGFKFYEEHPVNIALSDTIYVYYSQKAYKDVANYVASLKMKHAPDEQFNYGTHQPMLAMGMLKKAINNPSIYDELPWDLLFKPLGMTNIVFERDQAGTFLGGSTGWGVAKEYAKIGLLMLEDGIWEGKRILPEGWVKFATQTVAPALLKKKNERGEMRLNVESYGAYWWLNKKLPMNKTRPYPSAPDTLFQAMGFRGQTMGVLPEQGIIIVRLGSDGRKPKKKLKRDKLYGLLLNSLKENHKDQK